MGYCMTQRDTSFVMTVKQQREAFKPVREKLLKNVKKLGGGSSSFRGKIKKSYAWVDMGDIRKAENLQDILLAFGWRPEVDVESTITDLYFEGEKLGDDQVLFDSIAPYVKQESFIEMVGEDNYIWRWIFKNGKCKEVSATLTFED